VASVTPSKCCACTTFDAHSAALMSNDVPQLYSFAPIGANLYIVKVPMGVPISGELGGFHRQHLLSVLGIFQIPDQIP
jgi:hypothetical protein